MLAGHPAGFTHPRHQLWLRVDASGRALVVLLANDAGALPLGRPTSIAVIGPAADEVGCLLGCYSFPTHVMAHHADLPLGVDVPTTAPSGGQERHDHLRAGRR